MANIISCKNIAASYNNKVALKNISFSVPQNSFTCIVGSNGSGKTTLLKLILNLMKPSSGEIVLNDLKTHEIGYLPQRSERQYDFPTSVQEVVLSGRINQMGLRPFYTAKDKSSAARCVEKLDIENIKKKSFQELSGGQQQKVLLARAMCAAQKLLLVDEPTSGLDPTSTIELYELLQKLHKENDMAILMVTHDLIAAVQYADQIIHLQKEILFCGSPQDYKTSKHYFNLEGVHHA